MELKFFYSRNCHALGEFGSIDEYYFKTINSNVSKIYNHSAFKKKQFLQNLF